jgi:hypothetical protein
VNYQKHYDLLIERGLNRSITAYTERHHIIPKCLGGKDAGNIVRLTPEEHYVAHQLLVKLHPNEPKLVYAARKMCHGRKSNKWYGWLRRKYAEAVSRRVVSQETRAKFSALWSGSGNPMFGKPSPRGRLGKKASNDTIIKQAQGVKLHWARNRDDRMRTIKRGENHPLFGTKASDETRAKLSASRKGNKNGMYGRSAISGRRWVNGPNGEVELIVSTQLQERLQNGWKLGRK